MRFFEYQAKNIFSRYSIPIPRGRIALNAVIADQIHDELKTDVVIKAQVLAGGRGKAGGVRLAKSSDQVEDLSTEILGLTIKGLPVRKILVEEAVKIRQEYFLAIILDKEQGYPVIMASKYGGVDIEDAAQAAEKIISIPIDPLIGLQGYQVRTVALALELPKEFWEEFNRITINLWRLFTEIDADVVEINPLVISENNGLIALDAKITVDDNALFRHSELVEYYDLDVEDRIEYQAKKYGLAYVKLTGNIGCMVNGAGLSMATLDLIQEQGGKPANFLDIGGGANAEKVAAGLKILLMDRRLKAVLVNIFGGITRCDEVARGLLAVLKETNIELPVFVRLAGTRAVEGLTLLQKSGFVVAETINEAIQKCVSISKKSKRST